MKLTIFADESFTEVREVRERDRMKIPYRVGEYVVAAISEVDLNNDEQIIKKVLDSAEQITAVVRATFGLTDEDLDHVDMMELADLGREIIGYVVQKMADMGVRIGAEGGDPNAQQPAPTA